MKQTILGKWFAREVNFGDLLAPLLLERLSGKRPINLMHSWRGKNLLKYDLRREADRQSLAQLFRRTPEPEYLTVGSVLGWCDWRADVQVVWGAGFMTPKRSLRHRPRRIHAVRGALTFDRLPADWQPEVMALGDPGLLVPDHVPQPQNTSAKIGVIAHYTQRGNPVLRCLDEDAAFKFVDIQQSVETFAHALSDCETVLSSAMHGLIAADAYGIPNRWVNFGALPDGGTFKFRDYYSAVGNGQDDPDLIESMADLRGAAHSAKSRTITSVQDALRKSHPFLQAS